MRALLLPFLLFLSLGSIRAADDPRVAALQAADDERVAAMVSADPARLGAIFSEDLHYAHASGVVDSKPSLIEVIGSGKTKYLQIAYEERQFSFPAPQIALMYGRARVQVGTADLPMSFLGVWREENGRWKFLAWQSSKLAPPVAK